jgi:hypothetical protein
VAAVLTKGKAVFIFRLRCSCFLGQGSGIIVQIFPKAAFLYFTLEALSAQDQVAFIGHFSPSGFNGYVYPIYYYYKKVRSSCQ